MSMRERTNERDLTYSRWHRPDSLGRFLGRLRATKLNVIDIDWCEACYCGIPVALIETQKGSHTKAATITTNLARMAALPAYSVGYLPNIDCSDIDLFSVRELWPNRQEHDVSLTPIDYAEWLESLRIEHWAKRSQNGGKCEPPL